MFVGRHANTLQNTTFLTTTHKMENNKQLKKQMKTYKSMKVFVWFVVCWFLCFRFCLFVCLRVCVLACLIACSLVCLLGVCMCVFGCLSVFLPARLSACLFLCVPLLVAECHGLKDSVCPPRLLSPGRPYFSRRRDSNPGPPQHLRW